MANAITPSPDDEWEMFAFQWQRHLKARNVSESTTKAYLKSVRKLAQWAGPEGYESPSDIKLRHLEEFFADQFGSHTRFGKPPSASTLAMDFRHLKVFYKWLSQADGVPNPTVGWAPPKVPESPVPVFDDDQLRALLATCKGRDFASRRDAAIIRIFFDCGIRLAEMAGIHTAHVDLTEQIITVTGKGNRTRRVPYGVRSAEALDTYLRMRARHKDRRLPNLWLAAAPHRGPLHYRGFGLMLNRRAKDAGLEGVRPHRFRHHAAHSQLDAGLSEGDAMRIFGWRSRTMVDRYGESAAATRAIRAARNTSPADRV